MVVNNTRILTWIGFTSAPVRNAIVEDFLEAGIAELQHMSDEDVNKMCDSYAKREDGPFPVICTSLQRQRIRSLVLWVKDTVRAGLELSFPDGTTRDEFVLAISASMAREKRRKEQKKIGESFLDTTFNTKLKTQSQWEKFMQELESTLGMIIGSNGVPLSYIIRTNEAAEYDEGLDFDEAVINAVGLEGEDFKIDARTVHQIILRNVHEDSDAYTYIKPLLRRRNGRLDIVALRQRYDNDATKQAIINMAKASLGQLRYKNERSFSFEKFSSKLQKAYDDLETNGRKVDNGDIVDDLWARIQNADIQMYISSLKVDYQRTPRSYQEILQDIAAEIASKSAISFSTTRNVSATYTRQGPCPKQGAHKDDGTLFIGNYTADAWRSDSVKPYHQEILNARSTDGGGSSGDGANNGGHNSRSHKRRIKAIKRNKKKLHKLNQQIAAAKAQLKDTSATEAADSDGDNAGNAFGGKNSKGRANK